MAASQAPWLSSRVGDEEAVIDGLVENCARGSAVVVDGGRGSASSLTSASQLRTAGAVINVSHRTRGAHARSSASVLVAVGCGLPDRRSLVPDPFLGLRHQQLLSSRWVHPWTVRVSAFDTFTVALRRSCGRRFSSADARRVAVEARPGFVGGLTRWIDDPIQFFPVCCTGVAQGCGTRSNADLGQSRNEL